jgi:hypothetical protein
MKTALKTRYIMCEVHEGVRLHNGVCSKCIWKNAGETTPNMDLQSAINQSPEAQAERLRRAIFG